MDKTISVKPIICTDNYDTLLLKYSNQFTAVSIDLGMSLTPELSSFLLKIDTNCLRKQTEYQVFIITILAKLYYYHLVCCNQGYDLYSMTKGASGIIINEFEIIGNYKGKQFEMLNSGNVVEVIEDEKPLKNNKTIQELIKRIKKELARIEIGNI